MRLPHALDVDEARITAEEVEPSLRASTTRCDVVRDEMRDLRERLHGALAQEVGEFLDLHALLLDDPELLQGLDALIRTGLYTADYALRLQRNRIAAVFEGMDDAYLRSRIDDIDQVIGRLHAALHASARRCRAACRRDPGHRQRGAGRAGAAAGAGRDGAWSPPAAARSRTARSWRAACTCRWWWAPRRRCRRSTTATCWSSTAAAAWWCCEPGRGRPARAPARASREASARAHASSTACAASPSRTLDGVDIKLWANAESRDDVAEAHALGAAGVGLYRTEFLFLGSSELPDEEAQFRAYRDVVLGMTGRTVTIRTLDLGADKADRTGLALRDEPNPALGLRGVRLSLARSGAARAPSCARSRAPPATVRVRVLVPMVSGARGGARGARQAAATTSLRELRARRPRDRRRRSRWAR